MCTCTYNPPQVDRIQLWVYQNKIPIHPIFYLLKGDYRHICIYGYIRGMGNVHLRQSDLKPCCYNAATDLLKRFMRSMSVVLKIMGRLWGIDYITGTKMGP